MLGKDNEEYVEEDRAEALKNIEETFPENLKERFEPGSYGHFELTDRSMVIMENWFQYIMEHPSAVMDEELYKAAHQIGTALYDFYQMVALKDFDADEINDKVVLNTFANWAEKTGNPQAVELVKKYLNRNPMGPFFVKRNAGDEEDTIVSGLKTYGEAYMARSAIVVKGLYSEEEKKSIWIEDSAGNKWYPANPDFHKLAE